MAQGIETIKSIAQVANSTVVIPAGYFIQQLCVVNTTANAVTGGIRIGTTDGGVDVVAALAVAGNAFTFVADASMLKRLFSLTVDTTLFIQTVTLWNSANVNVYFICRSLNAT